MPVIHSYCIAGNIIGRENNNGGHQIGIDKDVSFTLNTVDRHAVCVPYGSETNTEIANTLRATHHMGLRKDQDNREQNKVGTLQAKENGGYSLNYTNPVRIYNTVRRLTPTECERLQGLPDGYTAGGSDSARYKALGNGMAQPCADYVMYGIAKAICEDIVEERSQEK